MNKAINPEIQALAIKRRNAIYVPKIKNEEKIDKLVLASFINQLSVFGIYLDLSSESIMEAIKENHLTNEIMTSVINALKYMNSIPDGAKILYPNFPEEVEATSYFRLIVDALIYAASGFKITPEANPEFNRAVDEYKSFKPLVEIGFIDEEELYEILINLLETKTAPSDSDIDDMYALLDIFGSRVVKNIDNIDIKFKEILVRVYLYTDGINKDMLKTPTDLLRVLQFIETGRADLNGRFGLPLVSSKTSKELANLVVEELSSIPFNPEDIMRYREEWKFILRHVEKTSRIKTYEDYLYRRKTINTFNSEVEALIKRLREGEDVLDKLLNLLSERPSELLRRVDSIVRITLIQFNEIDDLVKICKAVEDAASLAERRISYQLLNHLERRSTSRVVNTGERIYYLEPHKEELVETICISAIKKSLTKGIIRSYEKEEECVVVQNKPELDNFTLSTSNKTDTENFQGLVPGMKFNLPIGAEIVRLFCHWENIYWDIDLSALMISDELERLDVCAYYSLKTGDNNYAIHSGDVREGPGQEFIDIDINKAKADGVRYVFLSVYNYSHSTMEEVKVGLSLIEKKEDAKFGKIHKEDEVFISSELASRSGSVGLFALDLETMEIIWLDAPFKKSYTSNAEENIGLIIALIKYYQAKTISVKECLELRRKAGKLIFDNDGEVLVEERETGVPVYYHDKVEKIVF